MGLFDALMAPLVAQQQYTNDKQMYQQQYLDSVDFTNQMLAYNTPAKQMERLKEGGVNPATTMMNGGQVQTGNQPAPAQLPTPVSHDYAGAVAQMLSSLGNNRLMNAQAKTEDRMREVRYENVQKQNGELDARMRGLNASATAQEIANQYADAREQWSLAEKGSTVKLNLHQVAVYQQQVKRYQYELEKILPAALYESITRSGVNIMSLYEMTAAIEDYESKIAERKQNVEESKSRQGFIAAQQGLVEQETKTEEQQTDIKKVEAENAQSLTDRVIEQYDKTIDNIAKDTDKKKEEIFWYSFDEADKLGTSTVLGTRIPYNRFRNKGIRDKFEKTLENRLREHTTVYYPKD